MSAKPTPRVFISSTVEDLEPFRLAAKEAALTAGFHPVMMDYFAVQSAKRPYDTCMAEVDGCDVLVAIAAYRYGWVPADQSVEPKDKSITWLECERAQPKKEVLAFLVDEKHQWPPQLRGAYLSTKAIEDGTDTPELIAEVKRNVAKLREFREWLRNLGTRGEFTTAEELKTGVLGALFQWLDRHPEFRAAPAQAQRDPAVYLSQLRDETAWIDIRGLQVGTGKAHRFPIGDLYIPLKTVEAAEMAGEEGKIGPARAKKSKTKKGKTKKHAAGQPPDPEAGGMLRAMRGAVPLEEALRHQRLVIVGDPGSGKSTFLRRIAYELCRDGHPGLQLEPGFPLFIRVAELEEHIRNCRKQGKSECPTTRDAAAWIPHFLEHRGLDKGWALERERA